MIKNVIFDFGCVLIHWDQHNLYDSYFGSKEKTDWFVDNICTWEWNNQTDVGKSFAESVAETFPVVKDKFSVFGMMDGIVMSGEEMISKPDLRIYQILLDRYGLKAEECVFIDDRKSNTEAGEKLGIQGIVFENCEQAKAALENIKNHEDKNHQ